MFITNSKHKDFKIINSKDNNNKFVLRLFNFELFSKKHHSNKDLENNNVFILDLEFNSIREIYDYIKQFKTIYVALDRDATTKSFSIVKELRSKGFDNVKVKHLTEDLKYYNSKQIRNIFYGENNDR